MQAIDQKDFDARTCYVEGFPLTIGLEELASIFGKIGPISYVKLPKFKDGQLKRFAFVEFQSQQHCAEACTKLNNFVPQEFHNVAERESLTPMRVISKAEWLQFKRTLTEIKQEVGKLAFGTDSELENKQALPDFEVGSLLKLTGAGLA